ncbi:MAG: hypothetical protein JSV97_07185 [candidate division WOR-3 bacterium]|nr:MAG: hypothetical protein JSV97_07185 [candidate division WOR-3 bacterium]
MKKVHLYEAKLIDGTVHRGEIVYKDDETIIFKLDNKETIRLSRDGIMLIKDLGWQKVKK